MIMTTTTRLVMSSVALVTSASAFTSSLHRKGPSVSSFGLAHRTPASTLSSSTNNNVRQRTPSSLFMNIISPFDDSQGDSAYDVYGRGGVGSPTTATATEIPGTVDGDSPLELTYENVELVLDEMRPYLIQDGGNVAIQEIDGPVVKLELQGACGTCPSSTQTMKMGLERKLRERIPEIQEVIQAMPEGPELNYDQVDFVLEGVRPFLQVAGGTINCESITGEGSVQPVITLKMEGSSASLNSVKLEIAQRLQRHFMMSGLRVEWA